MATEKQKRYMRAWYQKHPNYTREYYEKHLETILKHQCEYRKKHPNNKPESLVISTLMHYNKRCDGCGHNHFETLGYYFKKCMCCHKTFSSEEFDALKDVQGSDV